MTTQLCHEESECERRFVPAGTDTTLPEQRRQLVPSGMEEDQLYKIASVRLSQTATSCRVGSLQDLHLSAPHRMCLCESRVYEAVANNASGAARVDFVHEPLMTSRDFAPA